MGKGIDYGMGTTNIDKATGIRFGVIGQNAEGLSEWLYESLEADYGDPACPKCGRNVKAGGRSDYRCPKCRRDYRSDEVYGEEPLRHVITEPGYKGTLDTGGDIFVTLSPYYTHAQYCSPCAPGACHLENPDPEGDRAYCLGHDWFDGGRAPYPVYSVETGQLVEPEAK